MKNLNLIACALVLSILFYSCDKNEYAPEIADQELSVAENSPAGTIIGTIAASDADEGQLVSYEIIAGNDKGEFLLDPDNGILTLSNQGDLDYESIKEFILEVNVVDNHDEDPLESSAQVKILVIDENEFAPVTENQVINLTEIPQSGTQITVIEATDEDVDQQLRYEIIATNRPGFLEVDSISGAVRIKDPEAIYQLGNRNIYFKILVKDDHVEWLSDTATIDMYVIDLKDRLALYLPMSGGAVDQSTNNIPTIVNGPVPAPDRFGNPDHAYLFDGEDDSINLNNNLPLIYSRQFTISIWAKFEGKSQSDLGSNVFFEQLDDYTNSYISQTRVLFIGEHEDKTGISLKSTGDGSVQESTTNGSEIVYDGEWHHYLASLDELSRLRVYIDGKIVSQAMFIDPGEFVTDVDHVNLGTYHFEGDIHGAFNGSMDEVLIFNRALKEYEIYALFSDVLKE